MASEPRTRRSSRGSYSDPPHPSSPTPTPTSSTAGSVSCTLCNTSESLVWLPHVNTATNPPPHSSEQVVLCTTCAAAQHSVLHNTRLSSSKRQRHSSASSTASNLTAAKEKVRATPTTSTPQEDTAAPTDDDIETRKSNPFRYPRKSKPSRVYMQPSTSVCDRVYHHGVRFEPGDIVSVVDRDNQGFYFAFVRGLMSDIEANKFAFLTWLLPFEPTLVKCATKPSFVPSKYCMGPQDYYPRPIECLRFECSSPLSASYRYPKSKVDSPFM